MSIIKARAFEKVTILMMTLFMSFQIKMLIMYISGEARTYDDLGVVFYRPPAIQFFSAQRFPPKDTDNLKVESIKCLIFLVKIYDLFIYF